MHTVQIGHECGCFKKSDYASKESFSMQKDAYNYAHALAELMNDDFCQKHLFEAKKLEDDNFVITVVDNSNAGSCSTGSCGPCGC